MGFYKSKEFIEFIEKYKNIYNIPMIYLEEKKGIGTAGGLRLYYDTIIEGNPDEFIIINGDICCNHPLNEMYKLHENNKNALVMMGVSLKNLAHEMYY